MQVVFAPSFFCVFLGEICEEYCCLEILWSYSFDDLTDCQNLWGFGVIPSKAILIFLKSFLDFRSYMIEKQGIINLSSYSSLSYTFVVLWDSLVSFLGEKEGCNFSSISLLSFDYRLCWRSMLSNFLVF